MTRKHFEAIAADMKSNIEKAENVEQRVGIYRLMLDLCETFSQINPNFNRGIFLEACGVN